MQHATGRKRHTVLEGKRILVVEDEIIVAMAIEDELIEAGAMVLGPVVCIRDALQLLHVALADGGIGAAVLDLNLNGEMAFGIADELDRHRVPYVIATGYSADFVALRGAALVQKPYNPRLLVEVLETVIRDGA